MSHKLLGYIMAGAGALLLAFGLLAAAPEEEKGKPLGKVPADVALVCPDCSAFVTVRLSELAAQPFAALLSARTRDDLLAEVQDHFVPADVERLTVFSPEGGPVLTVIRTRKAYDREQLVGKREQHTLHGKKVYSSAQISRGKGKEERAPPELDPDEQAVWPVDAQTVVQGSARTLGHYLAGLKRPIKGHALADELALGGKHTVVIGLRPRRLLQQHDLVRRQQMREWEERRKSIEKELPLPGPGRSPAPRARKVADKDERPADKPAPLKVRSAEEIIDEPESFRPEMLPFKPLLQADRVLITADVGAEVSVTARANYLREEDAKDGQVAVQTALYTAREMVPILFREAGLDPKERQVSGVIKALQAGIRGAVVERDGTTVKATLKMKGAIVGGAVKAVGALAQVRQAENNLTQIGTAFHNYQGTYDRFPAAAIVDKDGKPLLSWRVAILPFIEEDALYKEFKLDEPWDSPHNKKLLATIPRVYAPVAGKAGDPGTTFWQVFTGPNTPFPSLSERKGPHISATFADGTSSTFLVAEGSKGVPWTRPEDLAVDPKKPLPKLGAQFERFLLVLFADGSVMRIRKDADEKVLRLLIDPRDGVPVDPGKLRPR